MKLEGGGVAVRAASSAAAPSAAVGEVSAPEAAQQEGAAPATAPADAGATAAPAAAAPAGAGAAAAPAAAAPAATAPAAAARKGPLPPDDDFKPSAAIVEVLINFLIRVGLITADLRASAGLSERCIKLLELGLAVWPEANIKYHFFEKPFCAPSETGKALLAGLSILRSILEQQPAFLIRDLKQLQALLRPALESHLDHQRIVGSLCAFLSEALVKLWGAVEARGGEVALAEAAAFRRWLLEATMAGLASAKEPQVYGALRLLEVLLPHTPELTEQHFVQLAKLTQRLAKELVLRGRSGGGAGGGGAVADDGKASAQEGVQLGSLKLAIQLAAKGVPEAGDVRKLLLLTLVLLIDRSQDADLLLLITKVVGEWITHPGEGGTRHPNLTPKESANLILKMSAFEAVPSSELHVSFTLPISPFVTPHCPICHTPILDFRWPSSRLFSVSVWNAGAILSWCPRLSRSSC